MTKPNRYFPEVRERAVRLDSEHGSTQGMTTLVRLAIWVPAGSRDEFAGACESQLVPLLQRHGLTASPEKGRPTSPGVFSRLFAVETPAQVDEKRTRLGQDPAWQQALQHLGAASGRAESAGSLHCRLDIYEAPAGPGQTVEAGPGFRQGLWRSFGVQDGLPYSIVDILQTRDGHLWLATAGAYYRGVCRFDGNHFATYSTADGLAGNRVRALLEDRQGNLWIGTEGGVSCYDGTRFATYTCADGLGSDAVLCMLEDRAGRLWFGTEGAGVSRYDGTQWVAFAARDGLAHECVLAVLEDRQGNLWFGTGGPDGQGGGVSRYDGREWVTYTAATGPDGDPVLCLQEDREGCVWAGTGKGDLWRHEGEGFCRVKRLGPAAIRDIAMDGQGHLWFATIGNGICRYDGAQWVDFTIQDGLANDQVFSITAARQGNLWCGTITGISRLDLAHFVSFTTRDGLVHNGVMSLLEDRQGSLWAGTFQGVGRYDGAGFTAIAPLAGWHVWSLLEDRQGHLWFGEAFSEGLMRYDGIHFTPFTTADGLVDNAVLSMLEDRQGHLWVGTRRGISRYDGEEWVSFTTADGLADDVVGSILEDRQGNLWVGTWGGGVSRYDGEEWVTFTTADGLVAGEVHSILEDRRGHLWFGTFGGGVSRYDGQAWITFTTADGLAADWVRSILEDRQGHLWFGTFGGGVSRYDGRVFQRLSRQDGLVFDVVQALVQDQRGDIWIGTEGGITRYRPASIVPEVQLRAVVADQRHDPGGDIRIPVSQKLVIFEFQGRSWTTPPGRMAYVCQLEGYDAEWKPVYRGRAEYQQLPEGEYTFQVRAVDRDLNYSEPARVRLSVEPDALVESLTATLSQSGPQGEFVGRSPALLAALAALRQVAPSDLTVLIQGETGTGKGLAARTLHDLGPRHHKPFITVSCGAVPEQLIESELFGHEKGAFTGAVGRRLGKVELAQGGTLFLDEIGDMPLTAQVKLLRLLEERTFERVGGSRVHRAEVRVVAATNRDLRGMAREGRFREDLYFRLQGYELLLPPLRQRREDIGLLALYFIGPSAAHLHKQITGLSAAAEAALVAHDWPGNVRELQHTIERAVVGCTGPAIQVEHLLLGGPVAGGERGEPWMSLAENEQAYIRAVLEATHWRISGPQGAAIILGVPESTLRTRMKKLGIQSG